MAKIYDCGKDYLLITEAAIEVAKLLGYSENDEKIVAKIYSIIRKLISKGDIQAEDYGKKMKKVKKSQLKHISNLVSKYVPHNSNIDKDDNLYDDVKEESEDYKVSSDPATSENIHFVKEILNGSYDELLSPKEKKKLLREFLK